MGEPANPGEDALQAGQRLVNLTEHDVMLMARPRNSQEGVAEPSLTRIQAYGRFARVDDEAARLHERMLDTEAGVVRLTWLRRLGRLVDLSAPRAGTRYVVSRVTALAARDRGDLVFPFDEIRDDHGRVTGAQGLASFRPRPAIGRLPGAWRAAARERRQGRRLDKQTLTGVLFAVATALLSAALALFPGALDEAKASGWGAARASWTLRLTVVFAAAGLTALAVAAWRWHRRGVMLEDRGTAYVIEEQVITWRHEEKESVLADVGEGFAAVLRAPELPWQAFPAAAESIADWVVAQATAHPGRVVLLATRIPQELAVGLGVQLGQRSWDRTGGQRWPQQVYPVLYACDSLVIPDLQLGAGSVPSQRQQGG